MLNSRSLRWFINHPRLSGFFIFLFTLIVGVVITWQTHKINRKTQKQESLQVLHSLKQGIEQVLKQSYNALITLALTVDSEGNPEDFEEVAKRIKESNEVIDVLELVPGGVIKYIYPMEGNEEAMNYNILEDPNRNEEAFKAIKENRVFFAGPLELKQGGMAVVGRLPIFINQDFWGFSAVIVKLKTLIQSLQIEEMKSDRYYFQFSKINPVTEQEEFFLPQKEDIANTYTEVLTLPDGDWKFYLTSINTGVGISVITLSVFTLILSITLGLFTTLVFQEPFRLQLLIRQQSKQLDKSEQNYRALFDLASDGIFIANQNGSILNINRSGKEIVGLSGNDLSSLHLNDFLPDSETGADEDPFSQLLSGDSLIGECVIKRQDDGMEVPVEISAVMLPDGKIQGSLRDISERKRSEEALRQAEEKLYHDVIVAVEEEKQNFGQELHDSLGQLLTAISIHINVLILELEKKGEKISGYINKLKELNENAIHEARSISHGLMSSFIKNKGLVISIYELGQQFNSSKEIVVDIKVNEVDESKINEVVGLNLYRIVQELTNNIIKHSKADQMEIKLEGLNGSIRLEISDNGIGLPKNNIDENQKGAGLTNVYNRIQLLRGELEIVTHEGEGTTFVIQTPLA